MSHIYNRFVILTFEINLCNKIFDNILPYFLHLPRKKLETRKICYNYEIKI